MRLLVPGRSGLPALADLDDAGLFRAYAAPEERWVRCNMVTSLDGAATGADGRSGSINDEADQYLTKLGDLQKKYAMRMPTVADRLAERFVRPLAIGLNSWHRNRRAERDYLRAQGRL